MAFRPRIGLTMRLELETRRFYLGRDYSEAVEAVGGLPVHLALIPDADYIDQVVADLDGILLPGSDSDVDPEYFGQEPHPKLGRVVPEKDETDRLVIEAAEKRNLPILAICYGMQALNVARGGTLVQDIGSQVENCLKHQQGLPLDRNSHSIAISGSGILKTLVDRAELEKIKVNSHHHQAIGMTGKDLKATASAADGVVECIEDEREDRFILGVQWHPELTWRTDVLSAAIFDEFVAACQRLGSTAGSVG